MSGLRCDEDLSLAQIAIRIGAAFAPTAAFAAGIFFVFLFIAGTVRPFSRPMLGHLRGYEARGPRRLPRR
jgi:hypothetical protein